MDDELPPELEDEPEPEPEESPEGDGVDADVVGVVADVVGDAPPPPDGGENPVELGDENAKLLVKDWPPFDPHASMTYDEPGVSCW